MCAQALYLLRGDSWGRFGKYVCVCVSALSVMMHCMLETFLCHVFLLAQARSIRRLPEITPSGQVAISLAI